MNIRNALERLRKIINRAISEMRDEPDRSMNIDY
jgi:hypothetical protein